MSKLKLNFKECCIDFWLFLLIKNAYPVNWLFSRKLGSPAGSGQNGPGCAVARHTSLLEASIGTQFHIICVDTILCRVLCSPTYTVCCNDFETTWYYISKKVIFDNFLCDQIFHEIEWTYVICMHENVLYYTVKCQ